MVSTKKDAFTWQEKVTYNRDTQSEYWQKVKPKQFKSARRIPLKRHNPPQTVETPPTLKSLLKNEIRALQILLNHNIAHFQS